MIPPIINDVFGPRTEQFQIDRRTLDDLAERNGVPDGTLTVEAHESWCNVFDVKFRRYRHPNILLTT